MRAVIQQRFVFLSTFAKAKRSCRSRSCITHSAFFGACSGYDQSDRVNWNVPLLLASLLRNIFRKVFPFDVKQFRFLIAAPNSHRTIEDIENDQSPADGNSSSDDLLNSTSKRFVSRSLSVRAVRNNLKSITELCHRELAVLTVQFTCHVQREVKLRRPHHRQPTQDPQKLNTAESLTSPNPNRLTRIIQRPTQKTRVILPNL